MKKLLSLLSACVAVMGYLTSSPACASMVTTPWQSAQFVLGKINRTTSVNFLGFDPVQGNLSGVALKFVFDEKLDDSISSFIPGGVDANIVSATSTITVSAPLGLQALSKLTTKAYSGPDNPYSGNPAAGSVFESVTAINVSSDTATITGDVSQLLPYIGSVNNVLVNVRGTVKQNGLSPGVTAIDEGHASGIVYLQYIYDVPEPATIVLFVFGFLALMQWRRRRV